MNFEGQVAIVTGAASGIGRACALEFARNGASGVCIVDLAGEDLMTESARMIRDAGARVASFHANVSDYGKAERIVSETRVRLGGVHILVNAAGINEDAPVWKMTETQWERVLNVNLKGTFNYIRAVAPVFRAQSSGKIVNIASIEALRGRFGISNYAASKAGVVALTRAAAADLGRDQINVNAVAPGFIRTPMIERLPEEVVLDAARETVTGRIGEPEDVASVVAFLCTDAARHITGEVIRVDGGQML
ncbi:MAG TPA: SDR family NAD(P)-dependent oxidoreductase [Pyrinomonadaceae bacterium]|nr:SDR family NAD(P)-dependent oxidoreductase [Pyrinomonadaceae bacterium]